MQPRGGGSPPPLPTQPNPIARTTNMKTKTAKTAKNAKTPATPTNHTNPYREGGNYHKLFAFLLSFKGKAFNRDAVMTYAKGLKDRDGKPLGETAAMASVVVIMSPRKEGESRGDCRGNLASMGHLYYLEPSGIRFANGKSGEGKDGGKLYSLHWRATPLEPATRAVKPAQPAKVAKPTKGKVKATKPAKPSKR